MTRIEQLETWMRERMDAWKAAGGKFTDGTYINTTGCRCAISSCLPELSGDPGWPDIFLEACPFVDNIWAIEDIIAGFDSEDSEPTPFYQLGQRLAKDYLT